MSKPYTLCPVHSDYVSDLFKLMILLKKRENMTDEDFADYWLHAHAPLAKKMPGVRKYVVNLVKKPPKRESHYQGVVELWFENIQSMKTAFASADGHLTSEDTHRFVSDMTILYIDEHEITL